MSPLQLPAIIADNAGYDSADLVAQLRAVHTAGQITMGLSEYYCFTSHHKLVHLQQQFENLLNPSNLFN
jgi:T-complex protein 1 subunit beta